jgi:hypothetical protein
MCRWIRSWAACGSVTTAQEVAYGRSGALEQCLDKGSYRASDSASVSSVSWTASTPLTCLACQASAQQSSMALEQFRSVFFCLCLCCYPAGPGVDWGLCIALENPCLELLSLFHVVSTFRALLDFGMAAMPWASRWQHMCFMQPGGRVNWSSPPPMVICERSLVQSLPAVWLAAPHPDAGGQANRLVA